MKNYNLYKGHCSGVNGSRVQLIESLVHIYLFHVLFQNSKYEQNAFENQHTYPTSASLNKQPS